MPTLSGQEAESVEAFGNAWSGVISVRRGKRLVDLVAQFVVAERDRELQEPRITSPVAEEDAGVASPSIAVSLYESPAATTVKFIFGSASRPRASARACKR